MRYDDLLNEAIDAAKASGEFVPSVVAQKLVASVEEAEPAALTEWLNHNAVRMTVAELSLRLRAERSRSVAGGKARSFADAVAAAESGDLEALRHFRVVYEVDANHTRVAVADMTGSHHKFVSDAYEARGQCALMLAAFHRAVAKKVGKRKTSEVFTEDQYHEMLRSIVRQPAA